MNQSARNWRYQVYVLRLWQEPGDAREHCATWRYVLEEPKTRQRRGFSDLATLMDFLKMEQERGEPTDKQ